jgi:regulatory protein
MTEASARNRGVGPRSAAASAQPGERVRRALELAMRRLNRRELTTVEMCTHLARNDVDPETVQAAIRELTAARYLDDERFARLFAQDRRSLDEWGAERIRRTLLGRGIDRDLIDTVLDGPDDDGGSDFERALALLRRRFPVPPQERRERDRAIGMLLRKGYDGDLALDVIASYCCVDDYAH